jgi:hypothetical protein
MSPLRLRQFIAARATLSYRVAARRGASMSGDRAIIKFLLILFSVLLLLGLAGAVVYRLMG